MKEYIIKPGDRLPDLEKQFKLPRSVILGVNPGIKDPEKLEAGMKLKMPETWIEIRDEVVRLRKEAGIKPIMPSSRIKTSGGFNKGRTNLF